MQVGTNVVGIPYDGSSVSPLILSRCEFISFRVISSTNNLKPCYRNPNLVTEVPKLFCKILELILRMRNTGARKLKARFSVALLDSYTDRKDMMTQRRRMRWKCMMKKMAGMEDAR